MIKPSHMIIRAAAALLLLGPTEAMVQQPASDSGLIVSISDGLDRETVVVYSPARGTHSQFPNMTKKMPFPERMR